MNPILCVTLVAAAFGMGIQIGMLVMHGIECRDPDAPPGRLERLRQRAQRRKLWKAKRREFIATGAIVERRPRRVETW